MRDDLFGAATSDDDTINAPWQHKFKPRFYVPIFTFEDEEKEDVGVGLMKNMSFTTTGRLTSKGAKSNNEAMPTWAKGETIKRMIKTGLTMNIPEQIEGEARLLRFIQEEDDALCAFMSACQVMWTVFHPDKDDWSYSMLAALLIGSNEKLRQICSQREEAQQLKSHDGLNVSLSKHLNDNAPQHGGLMPMGAIYILASFVNVLSRSSLYFVVNNEGDKPKHLDIGKDMILVQPDGLEKVVPKEESYHIILQIDGSKLALMDAVEKAPDNEVKKISEGKMEHVASILNVYVDKVFSHFITCCKIDDLWVWFDPSPNRTMSNSLLGGTIDLIDYETIITIDYVYKISNRSSDSSIADQPA